MQLLVRSLLHSKRFNTAATIVVFLLSQVKKQRTSLRKARARCPEDVKILRLAMYIQNENGVETLLSTTNYPFSLFCIKKNRLKDEVCRP